MSQQRQTRQSSAKPAPSTPVAGNDGKHNNTTTTTSSTTTTTTTTITATATAVAAPLPPPPDAFDAFFSGMRQQMQTESNKMLQMFGGTSTSMTPPLSFVATAFPTMQMHSQRPFTAASSSPSSNTIPISNPSGVKLNNNNNNTPPKQKQKEKEQQQHHDGLCLICMTHPAQMVSQSCGHHVTCLNRGCYQPLTKPGTKCPKCRKPVHGWLVTT
jgi:Zinc finger, C3HC4 type (RING finger)